LGNNKPSSLKFALVAGTGAFFTAVFFSFFSEVVLPRVEILILSFSFLMMVIFIGIIFDMIGVAVAVAEEMPFHAKASKKLKGAGHGILMLRNADKVATFCNDVVGDICGTVSGALGVAIIFQIVSETPTFNESILTMVMTGFVASLTVGGKAAGKRKAMRDSEKIVFFVARVLAGLEKFFGVNLLPGNQRKAKERKK